MPAHVRKLLLLALLQPWKRSPQALEGSRASGGNRRGDRAPCSSNICGRDDPELRWSDTLRPDLAQHRSLSQSVETRRSSSADASHTRANCAMPAAATASQSTREREEGRPRHRVGSLTSKSLDLREPLVG